MTATLKNSAKEPTGTRRPYKGKRDPWRKNHLGGEKKGTWLDFGRRAITAGRGRSQLVPRDEKNTNRKGQLQTQKKGHRHWRGSWLREKSQRGGGGGFWLLRETASKKEKGRLFARREKVYRGVAIRH